MEGSIRLAAEHTGDRTVNLPRLLNTIAEVYTSLRLAGWSGDEASRIVTEEVTKAINNLPHRSYPTDTRGSDHAEPQGHVPEQVDERQGS